MEKQVIAIDIGGTNFRIATVSQTGTVLNKRTVPSEAIFETGKPIEHLCELIAEYANDFPDFKWSAISISMPGEIALDRETSISMPNLRSGNLSLDGVNVVAPLKKYFGIPVFLEKDANNHLACDIYYRQLKASNVVVGIYFGTGVGCGLYINGKYIYGKHGAAGVLGHIPFYKSTMESHVGSYGCAETHASGYRLTKICEKNFGLSELPNVFTLHRNHPDVQDYLEAQATVIATVATLLDPELLVLGGGVVEMDGYPFEEVVNRARQLSKQPFPASDLKILKPYVKKDSGLIGAAFTAFEKLM